MQGELKSALGDYLKLVSERVSRTRDEGRDHRRFIVLRSRAQELVSLVEEVEEGGQFARLVQTTADDFSRDPSHRGSSKWKSHVQNFFRRSAVYQNVFAGTALDTASIHCQYVAAFRRTKIQITYFALLEVISFAEERMDFGDFQIRRFTEEELDEVLQQVTRRTFYPSWAAIDTELLAQYWFLTCSENQPAPQPGRTLFRLNIRVQPQYSRFPKPIEAALKRLVLFPWGTVSQRLQRLADLNDLKPWDCPARFGIPFCIAVSDSLIDHPRAMPDTSVLVTIPAEDPVTGEYLGERPLGGINLSEKPPYANQKTNQDFISFVRKVHKQGTDVERSSEWHFIGIALNFLVKAFFSEGLEQLLWHITAVEAVLGEKRDEGLTKLLKRRVGLILGQTEQERKKVAKLFEDLYNFRCDLVHGNKDLSKNKVNQAHLGKAREITRSVTLWMLHYLHHIRANGPENTPSREHVLAALDGNPQSAPTVAELLSRLPPGFPQVREWREG